MVGCPNVRYCFSNYADADFSKGKFLTTGQLNIQTRDSIRKFEMSKPPDVQSIALETDSTTFQESGHLDIRVCEENMTKIHDIKAKNNTVAAILQDKYLRSPDVQIYSLLIIADNFSENPTGHLDIRSPENSTFGHPSILHSALIADPSSPWIRTRGQKVVSVAS